jgi:hypothetical protein
MSHHARRCDLSVQCRVNLGRGAIGDVVGVARFQSTEAAEGRSARSISKDQRRA